MLRIGGCSGNQAPTLKSEIENKEIDKKEYISHKKEKKKLDFNTTLGVLAHEVS